MAILTKLSIMLFACVYVMENGLFGSVS